MKRVKGSRTGSSRVGLMPARGRNAEPEGEERFNAFPR